MSLKNKLRCNGGRLKKGGKVKKFSEGGIDPIPTDNIKIPTLATPLDTQTLAGGPSADVSTTSGIPADILMKGGDMVGKYLEGLINSMAPVNDDIRNNPGKNNLTRDNLKVAGSLAGNTAKGAGIGAAVGSLIPIPGIGTGVGAAIGAGIGAASTGIKDLMTSKAKKEKRAKEENDWVTGWDNKLEEANIKQGFKKGGMKKISGHKMSHNPVMKHLRTAKGRNSKIPKQQILQQPQGNPVQQSAVPGQGVQPIPGQSQPGQGMIPRGTGGMKSGGMHIKKENIGKETATEKKTGKSASQLAHSKNPVTAKRGNFARMAKRHWKPLQFGGILTTKMARPR